MLCSPLPAPVSPPPQLKGVHTFPLPISSKACSLPAVCHPTLPPAAQPAPRCPSAQENSAREQQENHRARVTYQQKRIPAETTSPACFGAYECLTLTLAREKAKGNTSLFLLIKWCFWSICLLHSPFPSSNATTPPERVTKIGVLFAELCLLLKSCCSEVCLVHACTSMCTHVSV